MDITRWTLKNFGATVIVMNPVPQFVDTARWKQLRPLLTLLVEFERNFGVGETYPHEQWYINKIKNKKKRNIETENELQSTNDEPRLR
jgi:hypothetical protein